MKSRRQNVSEDSLTILRRNRRSSSDSINDGEYSETIPNDLIIEILSRSPAKSVARCRCLSKLWASILRPPDFTELFFTRSSARPQLLFACHTEREFFFFSTPQPRNLDDNSSPLTASYQMKIPFDGLVQRFSSINGFVFHRNGNRFPVLVSGICNPSTGVSFALPKWEARRRIELQSYFGYDPIEKQFKVLCMAWGSHRDGGYCDEYQVMTLKTGKMSWRKIECCTPHTHVSKVICIDGFWYYRAALNGDSEITTMLVCFDFRSEKFRFMKVMEKFSSAVNYEATLINYNGKLGSLMSEGSSDVNGKRRSFELWVLEDYEKQEWSEHICVLPPLWENVVGEAKLYFVGVIGTDEIVLSSLQYPHGHFYLFYFNIKRNSVVRVEIQGMEVLKGSRVQVFLNHVENLKLIQAF